MQSVARAVRALVRHAPMPVLCGALVWRPEPSGARARPDALVPPHPTTGRCFVPPAPDTALPPPRSSVTTGNPSVVVWNIHQKTSRTGGATQHGWPDPSYLDRLKSECASVNVVDEAVPLE